MTSSACPNCSPRLPNEAAHTLNRVLLLRPRPVPSITKPVHHWNADHPEARTRQNRHFFSTLLIPDGGAEFPAPAVDLASLSELKERIRTVLLSRIDPTVAGRIPRAALRREIAKLVNEIATEERVQLNKLEEMALAADLSDDMVGLGPLEPFLDDEDITDILANGPFDIYVERNGKLEKPPARF